MSDHVVMFSGGLGSWMTARRVVEQHGTSNLTLLRLLRGWCRMIWLHYLDDFLRRAGRRIACAAECHDWHTTRPHWKHQCGQTVTTCRRPGCKAVR